MNDYMIFTLYTFDLSYHKTLMMLEIIVDSIVQYFENYFWLCLVSRLPLLLMSVAYFKIICVLWKSDTIPGHRESCNQTHSIRK